MNKIKNIMALIAVLVGITSTFAFKNPTSKNLVGTLFAEVPNALWLNVTNANDTTITFTAITDSGDHAYCEISNSNVCDVLAQSNNTVTGTAPGTVTVTHAKESPGVYIP